MVAFLPQLDFRAFFVFFVLLLSTTTGSTSPMFKSLAAPPVEVQARTFDMPVARAYGQRSNAMLFNVEKTFQPGQNMAFQYKLDVPTELGRKYRLQLLSSNAQLINSQNTRAQPSPQGVNTPGQNSAFEFSPAQTGDLKINILQKPPELQSINNGSSAKTLVSTVLVTTDSPYRLYSHFTHLNFLESKTIGLNAFVYDNTQNGHVSVPSALQSVVTSATLTLKDQLGQKKTFIMVDDGQNNDKQAGDGIFGLSLENLSSGKYQVSIEVKGTTPQGERFLRTSEHVLPIVKAPYQLRDTTKLGNWYQTPKKHYRLPIQLQIRGSEAYQTAQLSAELWGKNVNEQWVLVSWLGGLVTPLSTGFISQSVDLRWLKRAKISNALELRNVKLTHPEYHIVFSQKNRLALPPLSFPTALTNTRGQLRITPGEVIPIVDSMLVEDRPEPASRIFNYRPGVTNPNNNKSKIILSHGYCSGRVWEKAHTKYDKDTLEYMQLGVNISTDQFAKQLRRFGARLPSFSIIAHSQGGMAALHLYTFYYSGLDKAGPGRLIQTVGTPFQGTPLAGTPAVIASLLGIGCGANFDLTPEGAALWLARIPLWARERVYYYTTSVKDQPWRYDACHVGTDWLLKDPDDGVIEKHRAFLPGGRYLGHTHGECHSRMMQNPAQTENHIRNSVMRWSAAR